MIVDASALIAILRGEPDAESFLRVIESTTVCRMSAATYVEAGIVADGGANAAASLLLDEFILDAGITIEPFTADQAQTARQAYRDFGKGSGHPARLNFGDCFAYPLARTTGEPLLFKGNDFTHTDVRSALAAESDTGV